ncbi:BsaWI family type II restriction enzyme [Chroococcus sp. FPU101]|uniref:BsaWI family type II restriction enzyme n=1 Tax=Chroococcus sp. FPU101 TaxID=1974212 RepID=UPI001A8DEF27|nr:BsaWI family type II restriction enzyme [Chroococcus sp. FPU101]GFE69388.1 hypothetical protein CFPU101_19980 [Chroococcus sp. FPU101]
MQKKYNFIKEENQLIKTIKNAYYMLPVLSKIDEILKEDNSIHYQDAFNSLHDIIQGSKHEVLELINKRKKSGLIKDINQASKSVVGNIFPYSLMYIFLKNKEIQNIEQHIYITNRKTTVKGFDKISTIKLADGETQKPDCDLIIYSYPKNSTGATSSKITTNKDKNTDCPKCIILSLKTSLRERAAQTYKWKLLLEIANEHSSKIKEKYGIVYEAPEVPLICFVTVNFYNEINNPQQRGMLKFFDRSFLAKKVNKEIKKDLKIINEEETIEEEKTTEIRKQKPKEFISPLSELVNLVNEFFQLDNKE